MSILIVTITPVPPEMWLQAAFRVDTDINRITHWVNGFGLDTVTV
ncbi:MAG: hypothetical protein QY319_03250 [Candidatus Kapaibacterium sp.]|nr:MAG: hypothetical protein QY319_03250 [Candidatus Kapabacteria bacterium]